MFFRINHAVHRCAGCSRPIEGGVLTVAGATWHKECHQKSKCENGAAAGGRASGGGGRAGAGRGKARATAGGTAASSSRAARAKPSTTSKPSIGGARSGMEALLADYSAIE